MADKKKNKKTPKKPGPKKKPAQKSTGYEHELETIYKDTQGEMPDMTKLDYKKRSAFWRVIIPMIIILAVLAGAAWAGFFLYQSKPGFSGEKISVDVAGPFNVVSGEQVTYEITVTNDENVPLEETELTVTFPNGFIFNSASAPWERQESLTLRKSNIYLFDIPDVGANSEYAIEIEGQLIGEKGFKPVISARLAYSPLDYSSTFEMANNFTSEIVDTKLAVLASYPTQVAHEEEVQVQFDIKNLSDAHDLKNLKLEFDLPEQFMDPALNASTTNKEYSAEDTQNSDTENTGAEEGDDTGSNENSESQGEFTPLTEINAATFEQDREIFLDGLNPEQAHTYRLTGTFEVEQNQNLSAFIRVFIEDANGDYILQTEEELAFQIVKGELLTNLIINGSDQSSSVSFGEDLQLLLNVKNKSSAALGDLKIRLVLDSPVIDWQTLDDPYGGQVSSNQILWTQEDIEELRVMLPEDEIDINLSLALKEYEDVDHLSQSSLRVSSFYEVTFNQIDNVDTSKTIESATILNTFNSNTQLYAGARYFSESGEAVGSGPLPPQVGEKTEYVVTWRIENTFHELENLEISAELPSHVSWEFNASADAGNIREENGRVVWEVNRMPTTVNELNSRFTVSLTPQAGDVNKILTLLNETTISATDKDTGGNISLTANPLTTNLDGDAQGFGKGLVQPAQ